MTYQLCRGFETLSRFYRTKGSAVDVPTQIPLDEVTSLAGRIAARIHPKFCGQAFRGRHHIEWLLLVSRPDGTRDWAPVGVASTEYLEFILDQSEQARWESIATLVDKIDTFIADNISGIPLD